MARSSPVIEEFSTVTAKGQTTVPKPVRQALGLSEGDQIAFRVDENGVTVRRADENRDDPAIGAFLAFLAADIQNNPQTLKALSPDVLKRIEALIGDADVDEDAPIEGDVAL